MTVPVASKSPSHKGGASPSPSSPQNLQSSLLQKIQEFPTLVTLFASALSDEPPASPKDGGIIRDGYSAELDELRNASRDGKQWIAELQASERKRTGIDSLKIKFNNVFGYFIEITKSNVSKVPDDYQRKQTMANAERYITPGLKEVENKILGADERSKKLEYEEFVKLREAVASQLDALQTTADALATLDVLLGFAETAQRYQHSRPALDESRHLNIVNGRHPVLEQTMVDEKFVPNDSLLDPETSRLVILTGPNMAGKSTYIRQVALITLMAQVGAYVPAESAHIGLVDRIFCRVGASDDLSKGQSTFMVEMNETSLIINNATDKSLVILDEIGRGTATFDGLSIAWSVAEYLHDVIQSRTLFATHYHELCDLANTKPAVENHNVAVREWNDDIIFLRKILPGPRRQVLRHPSRQVGGLAQTHHRPRQRDPRPPRTKRRPPRVPTDPQKEDRQRGQRLPPIQRPPARPLRLKERGVPARFFVPPPRKPLRPRPLPHLIHHPPRRPGLIQHITLRIRTQSLDDPTEKRIIVLLRDKGAIAVVHETASQGHNVRRTDSIKMTDVEKGILVHRRGQPSHPLSFSLSPPPPKTQPPNPQGGAPFPEPHFAFLTTFPD